MNSRTAKTTPDPSCCSKLQFRQGVGHGRESDSRLTRVNFLFRGCKASASCKVETENKLGTIAILEINRKFEASPRRHDSLE